MKKTKEWPIFSPGDLIIGNPQSPIGICTLWSQRETFVKEYLTGWLLNEVAIVGNLYSVFGLGILIRNYLASPNMSCLIVTGKESLTKDKTLENSKKAIENLLTDSSLPKGISLDVRYIEKFLNQVNVVFTPEKGIAKLLSQNDFRCALRRNKNIEPIIIPLPEPKTEVFPAPRSGHLIRAKTIVEGYFALLKEIRLFGKIIGEDSEGHRRQELLELHMIITSQNPCDFSSIPHPEYGKKQIKKYCEDFWLGKEPKGLAYRYGHIIRSVHGDQVKFVKQAFKDKAETFRAVISLWDPKNSIKEKDPPCIITMHLRIISDVLYLWGYIRTNDMFNAWPVNVAALRYFQYKLLEELKVFLGRPDLQLGELGVTSGSAHLYEIDWPRVDAKLGERLKKSKFYPDPKGNFEVKSERGTIIVNHYDPDGKQLLQVFKGTTVRELSRKIEPFISQIGNALYIGRELQRAEKEAINARKNIKKRN